MSVGEQEKQFVRQRANFICEYCGVSEQSAGGELTIDHFRPQSKGGNDEIENLIYCCSRCNLYKSDFYVEPPNEPRLWNPRAEEAENHFWQAGDGRLFGLTETGHLSIRILNLNRPQLIEYRRRKFLIDEERRLLEEYETTVEILLRLSEEQREIIRAQQDLLNEQRKLLKLLLENY